MALAEFRLYSSANINRTTKKGLFSSQIVCDPIINAEVITELENFGSGKINREIIYNGKMYLQKGDGISSKTISYIFNDNDVEIIRKNILRYIAQLSEQRWNVQKILKEWDIRNMREEAIRIYVYRPRTYHYDFLYEEINVSGPVTSGHYATTEITDK